MTAPPPRIAAMDVLRGCAVMGILWMNISAFALPQTAYFNPAVAGPLSTGDKLFWLTSFLFFDGKMRALFSMLFGASMLLLIDREEMTGRNGQRGQIIRAVWLFLFGLAHYLLLWAGDILMNYALIGLVAMMFIRNEPLSLVKWAFLFFLAHFLICTAFVVSIHGWADAAAAPDAAASVRESFTRYVGSLSDPDDPAIRQEIATYRSGFSTIFAHHLQLYLGNWWWSLSLSAFDTLGFMLMGMAMLKGGFVSGRWQAEQYWRTARHCFLIGLVPMAALAAWLMLRGFPALSSLGASLAWSFPFRIPLAVGWAALILWIFVRHGERRVVMAVARTGRLALSNYLGTSFIMCAIFYGWGLGLFGYLRPAELPLVVICGWLFMLVWSTAWLARFDIGPFEWLWRSLARGKAQKIRNSI